MHGHLPAQRVNGTRDADVIVVGAGAAGAAAALEVDAAGASVIGLDLLPGFGGTAATSGGGCCIAGTESQLSRGIRDSPELALRDLLAAGAGEADEEWARFYLANAAANVHDWLVGLGVTFVDVHAQEHDTVPRWHQPRGSGRGLMDALWEAIEARGLTGRWRWSTRVEDLLVEEGRVVGVLATDGSGRAHELRAGAVVMATGGFAGDRAQVLEHAESLRSVERLLVGGGVGALGIGHRILADHGAALTHMGNMFSYAYATPDYRDAAGVRGLVVRGTGAGIWVNGDGRRFHDESRSGAGAGTAALLAQRPPTCWAILDRRIGLGLRISDAEFRGASSDRVQAMLRESPFIWTADTPDALARSAGIDPDGLARTLSEWNALVASGAETDPATGRRVVGLGPIVEPPYQAIQFFPLARKNLGGVRTDLECRVLTAAGVPIPGLFAAGELAGFGGGHLSGRGALEGIMIGASLFGGRVAGAWAAHEAGASPRPRSLGAESLGAVPLKPPWSGRPGSIP